MHQLARNLHLQQEGPALYELRDLSYSYPNGQAALTEINLDIAPGDRVAIIGQNGAGKSTLLKHLNGLLAVQQGSRLTRDKLWLKIICAKLVWRSDCFFRIPTISSSAIPCRKMCSLDR